MLRPMLISSILVSVFFITHAQTCAKYSFASNKVFSNCNDLPYLNSFLHYTHNPSSQTTHIAFRHIGITTPKWVAWGINTQSKGMVGTQALVAFRKSNGTMSVYTSPILRYQTGLQKGELSFEVSDLSATYANDEITIFATLKLPSNSSSLNQVWQDGPLIKDSPGMHGTTGGNVVSMSTLNLVSGQSKVVGSGGAPNSKIKKKNIHGVLNGVSWGIMMPLGVVIARYMKVFKVTTPAWYYLHATCQTSAYIIGVAGWATGLQLGSQSPGITYTVHRTIGIILFCLATIQATAMLLRPKKENKYRIYWNVYHHMVGYSVIILGILNIFRGFDILKPKGKYERDYIIFLLSLGAFAAFMEIFTWIIVLKRKKVNETQKYTSNEVNYEAYGYGPYTTRSQYGVV